MTISSICLSQNFFKLIDRKTFQNSEKNFLDSFFETSRIEEISTSPPNKSKTKSLSGWEIKFRVTGNHCPGSSPVTN